MRRSGDGDPRSTDPLERVRSDAAPPVADRGAPAARPDRLDPALRDLIRGWDTDSELVTLAGRIRAAHGGGRRDRLQSAVAEATVARRLVSRGASLKVEIETPSGRSCDLEVLSGASTFYLHVKRLRGPARRERLEFPARLRELESIARPFIVAVRWAEDLDDRRDALLVDRIAAFLRTARIGEELVVRDDRPVAEVSADAAERAVLGGCRVVAHWEHDHVGLVMGLPTGFIDETPRIHRLLRRAHRQFMPGSTNVTLVRLPQSSHDHDFEAALLGSPVERWDRFPRDGQRVAHGRAADGFWSGRSHEQSTVAGCFRCDDAGGSLRVSLWYRDQPSVDPALRLEIDALLGDPGHDDARRTASEPRP